MELNILRLNLYSFRKIYDICIVPDYYYMQGKSISIYSSCIVKLRNFRFETHPKNVNYHVRVLYRVVYIFMWDLLCAFFATTCLSKPQYQSWQKKRHDLKNILTYLWPVWISDLTDYHLLGSICHTFFRFSNFYG